MLMRRNVVAGIGSNEQGGYCRAALQRSDRKEPRYKWPTLLYFFTPTLGEIFVRPLGIPHTKLHTKFEVSSSSSFRDIAL